MIKTDRYRENVIDIEHNDQKYSINLHNIASELYENYGTEGSDQLELYKVNESVSLFFDYLSFDVIDEEINYISFDGYVLIKD